MTAPDVVSVLDALFTLTQQRVLALLYGQPRRAFTVTELIQLAQVGSGAVQREVKRLAGSGLVTVRAEGGRKLYQANPQAPIFEELRGLIAKTAGVAEQVRAGLEPARERIRFAILYGSVAKGQERAASDVDVLLVSDELTLEEVFALVAPVERSLSRSVSPTLYTTSEFVQRRQTGHPFLTKVLGGPHLVLLGHEDDVVTSR